MKNIFVCLFLSITVLFSSCKKQEQVAPEKNDTIVPVNKEAEIRKLDSLLSRFDVPTQTFKASSKKLIEVVGKQGTKLRINPNNLETENGEPLASKITVELKEFSNKEQLLRGNAQTVSNGDILVSGGAFYVGITSNGQKVQLKKGKTYQAQLPKLSDKEMSLFYGERDSAGLLNWIQAPQKFKEQKVKTIVNDSNIAIIEGGYEDSIITEYEMIPGLKVDIERIKELEELEKKRKEKIAIAKQKAKEKLKKENPDQYYMYEFIDLNKLGWINCDRTFNENRGFTRVYYHIKNKNINVHKASLFLKEYNAVISATINPNDDLNKGSIKAPIGMEFQIFCVALVDNQIYAIIVNPHLVSENLDLELELQPVTEKELEKIMQEVK